MHFYLVSLFLMTAAAIAENPNAGLGAEVVVSEALVRQLQFTQWQTNPFIDEGRWVTPNVSVVISPTFGNNVQGSAVARLNLSLSGTASSGETKPVGRRGKKQVNINVTNTLNGHYEQDIYVDARGLSPGESRGHTNAEASISVSNNFRLMNGLVNRIAFNEANGIVGAKLPIKMAEMDQKVTGQTMSAADQAGRRVAQFMADAGYVMLGEGPKNTQLHFKSTTGPQGAMSSRLMMPSGKDRKPPPKLDFDGQAMTKSVLHQDVVSEILNQRLAGKEVKFGEFRQMVCGTVSVRALDFCKQDLPAETRNTSILFSEPRAVDFIFENGKVIFKMHARYRKLDPKRDTKHAGIGPPTSHDVSMETEPYTVEVAYKMSEAGATLESLKVEDEAPARETAQAKKDGEAAKGWHLGSLTDGLKKVAGGAVNVATKNALQAQFSQLFKPKIDFGPVSFPTKISGGDNHITTVHEAGTLVPLETKVQDGWLGFSTGFCGEKFSSLGVTSHLAHRWGGGAPLIYVSSVAPGSPAALASLKVGDRIESYGVPGERLVNLHRSPDELGAFTRQRGAGASASDRTLEVNGIDASGKRFKRILSLCPSGYDHRGKAQATLSQAKR